MIPVFEAWMKPKDPRASIEVIIVRVCDPMNIDTKDKCADFLEKQFPFYQVEGVMQGYRNDNQSPN
jgi:hypothetical protein